MSISGEAEFSILLAADSGKMFFFLLAKVEAYWNKDILWDLAYNLMSNKGKSTNYVSFPLGSNL